MSALEQDHLLAFICQLLAFNICLLAHSYMLLALLCDLLALVEVLQAEWENYPFPTNNRYSFISKKFTLLHEFNIKQKNHP